MIKPNGYSKALIPTTWPGLQGQVYMEISNVQMDVKCQDQSYSSHN